MGSNDVAEESAHNSKWKGEEIEIEIECDIGIGSR